VAIEYAVSLIEHVNPQIFVLWNGLTLPTRAYAEVAKSYGVRVFFSERGYFPNTVIVDPQGVNYGSWFAKQCSADAQVQPLSTGEKMKLAKFMAQYHGKGTTVVPGESMLSREEVHERSKVPYVRTLILYVAQIDSDTNIIYYSPFYRKNVSVLNELADIVSRVDNCHLMVKLHPEDEDNSELFKSVLKDRGTVVKGINIHSLLAISDIVVVRNSTIGLEALTYNKPLITLGNSIYSHQGMTFDVTNKDELKECITKLCVAHTESSEKTKRIHRYLYTLLNEYLYFLNGDEAFGVSNGKIVQMLTDAITHNDHYEISHKGRGFAKTAIGVFKSHLHAVTCR
jgi:hypothetical protein